MANTEILQAALLLLDEAWRQSFAERYFTAIAAIQARDPAAKALSPATVDRFFGVQALAWHEVAHGLWQRGHQAEALAIAAMNKTEHRCWIHPAAVIGRGVILDHVLGVHIEAGVSIGDGCYLHHNTRLTNGTRLEKHARLGAHVVLDGVMVGENATVGAGVRGQDAVIASGKTVIMGADGAMRVLASEPPPPPPAVPPQKADLGAVFDHMRKVHLDWLGQTDVSALSGLFSASSLPTIAKVWLDVRLAQPLSDDELRRITPGAFSERLLAWHQLSQQLLPVNQHASVWVSQRLKHVFNIEIPPSTKVGQGVIFTPPVGNATVIGGTAIIGDNCQIGAGVTLGMTKPVPGGRRHPALEAGVRVGDDALVLGALTLSTGAQVADQTILTKDLPAGALAQGVNQVSPPPSPQQRTI